MISSRCRYRIFALSVLALTFPIAKSAEAAHDLFFYDGSTVSHVGSGSIPQMSGDKLVWYDHDGNDGEIYLYDHSAQSTTNISNNNVFDQSPQISGDYVTWFRYSASLESDVVLYDDATQIITQITHPGSTVEDDLEISGSNLVWVAEDGGRIPTMTMKCSSTMVRRRRSRRSRTTATAIIFGPLFLERTSLGTEATTPAEKSFTSTAHLPRN